MGKASHRGGDNRLYILKKINCICDFVFYFRIFTRRLVYSVFYDLISYSLGFKGLGPDLYLWKLTAILLVNA